MPTTAPTAEPTSVPTDPAPLDPWFYQNDALVDALGPPSCADDEHFVASTPACCAHDKCCSSLCLYAHLCTRDIGTYEPTAEPTAAPTQAPSNLIVIALSSHSYSEFHWCAITEDGRLKCVGMQQPSRPVLGLRHSAGRGSEPGEMGDSLDYVDLGTSAAGGPSGHLTRNHVRAARWRAVAALLG